MKKKLGKIRIFLEKHRDQLKNCRQCPRACGVNRNLELGECGQSNEISVASVNLHHGEEPPISGSRGSGTVFFSGCNLHCVFCQNFPISQLRQAGRTLTSEALGTEILKLQKRGAHNVNFVTPSHYVYKMVEALKFAVESGFSLPVVYNTSGYDNPVLIRDLEGIVDIYLPDSKYSDNITAEKFSDASHYLEVNRKVLTEIFRQTEGKLILDQDGIAKSGMILRHLVLPSETKNSKEVLKWVSQNLGSKIFISVMSQYFPAYRVLAEAAFSSINQHVEISEYEEILDYAESLGFENGFFQYPDAEGGA